MTFKERLRAFELKCQAHMSEFRCPVHLCLGQEDVPAALHEVMLSEDWLFSTHRNHGHYLAKGGSEQKLWDELMGLETGVNGGWAGSQCYSDPLINFHSTALVGGLIGVAVGTALALKRQQRAGIVFCCIGDGATEQGVFWESLNAAALWCLPMVFICENNSYSVHAEISERQCGDLIEKTAAFGIQSGWAWMGNDKRLRGLLDDSIKQARGNMPCFIEVECERECNHVGNMPDFRHGAAA